MIREWIKRLPIFGKLLINLYELFYRFKSIYLLRYYLLLYHTIALRVRQQTGINTDQIRSRPLIVSLTTIPSRLDRTALAISTLLEQTVKPDHILLWVSDQLTKNDLPKRLLDLQKRGLEIRFAPDWGPHTKLVHTLNMFPDSIIVTVDDDKFYPPDCVEKLYQAYLAEPMYVHCHSAELMTFDIHGNLNPYAQWSTSAPNIQGPSLLLFPLAVGGILYSPHLFHSDVSNVDLFTNLSPYNDDIWFRAMTLLTDTQVKKTSASGNTHFPTIPNTQHIALQSKNLNGGNDKQSRAVFTHYKLYDKLTRHYHHHQNL